ncbi:unnamed protein product [Ilex paraguariensis]|uniref:Pentatricopeptide repeat-containing protein n=1 Tax=Ilex paraguariensis TaxID=185542 RepID=A0ABC8RLM9_9AQUA
MPVRSWTTMIAGFVQCGKPKEAISLFTQMEEAGLRPNVVTVVAVLTACADLRAIDLGRKIHEYSERSGRAALLQEAYELIMNMPIEPNGVVWGDLPCGCKVHMNIEMAEEVTKHLLELDPLNDGYYTVLSNIYAEAKRWEDVTRVRKLLRDRGVKKTPGWSSITVDGVVHEFVAGDETLRRYSRGDINY